MRRSSSAQGSRLNCATLLDLYTNQIMDNLVRAKNGMPIIQLDYTNAAAQVTITSSIGGSDTQVPMTSNVLALPAATLTATRSIMTTLMGNASSMNSNQIGLTATPVTLSNEVYDAYLSYLTLPGALIVTHEPPPPSEVHLCKKYCGDYYWVPKSSREDFFRLALLTTAQRGKSLLPPDPFYSVQLTYNATSPVPDDKNSVLVELKLDNPIPNDSGSLVLIKPNGTDPPKPSDKFPFFPYVGRAKEQLANTSYLQFKIRKAGADDFIQRIKDGPTAHVFLDHNQPKPPTTDDLLNRVNFQLQQIQFNQLRQGGPL